MLGDVVQVKRLILGNQLDILNILVRRAAYQLLLDVGVQVGGERVAHIDTLMSNKLIRPICKRVYEIKSVGLRNLPGVIDQHFEKLQI